MYKNFDEIIAKAKAMEQKLTISVSVANEKKLLLAVKKAVEMGICNAILVGDKSKILPIMNEIELKESAVQIIDQPDDLTAALKAVELVSSGKAHVLVKGIINTSDYLRSVLDKKVGLRTGRLLCLMATYDIPGQNKLLFVTDGGMVIAPTLEEKAQILTSCIPALQNMGIEKPKVAILTANENVDPNMPSTVDAQALVEMSARGELPEAVIEGPIALDVAMNPDAAKTKGIASKISGDVDLILVPNMEVGNCLGKAIGYFAKGKMAGIVLGAKNPIVLTSRAASPENKFTSIALSLLAYKG